MRAYNYPVDDIKSPLVFAKLKPSVNESYQGLNEKNTEIFYDPGDVPENQTETSITLPLEIIDRYRKLRMGM